MTSQVSCLQIQYALEVNAMAANRDAESPLEQGRHDTEIRRDTAVRGSMGMPASGRDTKKVTSETDVFKDQAPVDEQESVRGKTDTAE
jgi:hypothetical protein